MHRKLCNRSRVVMPALATQHHLRLLLHPYHLSMCLMVLPRRLPRRQVHLLLLRRRRRRRVRHQICLLSLMN